MPNGPEHDAAALHAGFAFAFYKGTTAESPQSLAETLGGAVGGLWGGRRPDFLNPPTSPHHRGLAHGVLPITMVGAVALSQLDNAQNWLRSQAEQFRWGRVCGQSQLQTAWHEFCEWVCYFMAGVLAGFVAGYVSHLLLDFQTPRSLPII